MKELTIITNDPSLTAWGYAVLNTQGVVHATGCIKTEPQAKKRRIREGDDLVRRISEINKELLYVMAIHRVNYILGELPHGSQSAVAAKMIGVVTAIIQSFADLHNLGIEWYSEADVKKCLSGRRNLSKQETINLIRNHYDVQWTGIKYKDEAVADALAIFHAAKQQSNIFKFPYD